MEDEFVINLVLAIFAQHNLLQIAFEPLAATARMRLKFISTRICPATDMCNIDTFQMTLLYAILKKERICVGTWIYWSMLQCARENKRRCGATGLCLTTKQVSDLGIECGIYYKESKTKESDKDQIVLRSFDGCKNLDEDYARKNELKVPQFPKEKELEEEEDLGKDSEKESEGKPNKANETSDPDSD
ncbi:hypothetical protein J1N35_024675 [Gossypium stocksii]|uniref:Uncharacterized protein n=1 Tax=Gossypium stocksii TaxID=47602 RepID=A0A9D3ZWH8_9ROSI|nr:hypothetical protein J1N35_024675 [Gossypium stocksii]